METKHIGMIISFIFGFLGYIIIKFWIRPIWGYKKIKKNIVSDIKDYLTTINNERRDRAMKERIKDKTRELRLRSNELVDSYYDSLPAWYKILLKSKGESPIDASKHLEALSNTLNFKHAENRKEKIKHFLRI